MRRALTWQVIGLLCLWLWFAGGSCAYAQAIPKIVTALPAKSKTPWNVSVEVCGNMGNGYLPVAVTVMSRFGPVASDRVVRVELEAYEYWGGQSKRTVEAFIEIPENTSQRRAMIDVPLGLHSYTLSYRFHEDGEHYEDLDGQISTHQNDNSDINTQCSLLILDADAPDEIADPLGQLLQSEAKNATDRQLFPNMEGLQGFGPTNVSYGNWDDSALLNQVTQYRRWHLANLKRFAGDTRRWLSLTNNDFVLVSFADLATLQKEFPQAHEHLLDWALSGGNLFVYECGDKWDKLASLAKLAGVSLAEDLWQQPKLEHRKPVLAGVTEGKWRINLDTAPSGNEGEKSDANASLNAPFRWREYGLGTIVAISDSDALFKSGDSAGKNWLWLANTLGAKHLFWSRRHALQTRNIAPDFWTFLIPGIGQTPVFVFVGMISLFILVIGPLNYRFFFTRRRLGYLMLTVPLGAIFVTAGLFVYAFNSDGITTRARVRSFTRLEAGRAATVSRHNYFAVFPPSRGLAFPLRTAVYEMLPQHAEMGPSRRFLEWGDDTQRLRDGYLNARDQRQFTLVRVAPSEARLKCQELVANAKDATGKSTAKISVTNQLGVYVEQAFIRDKHQNIYHVENLAVGASRELTPANLSDANRRWQGALADAALREPPGFDYNRYASRSRSRRNYYFSENEAGDVLPSESLLEANYRRAERPLEPRGDFHYFVLASSAPRDSEGESLSPLGLFARVVQQSHLVEGSE